MRDKMIACLSWNTHMNTQSLKSLMRKSYFLRRILRIIKLELKLYSCNITSETETNLVTDPSMDHHLKESQMETNAKSEFCIICALKKQDSFYYFLLEK